VCDQQAACSLHLDLADESPRLSHGTVLRASHGTLLSGVRKTGTTAYRAPLFPPEPSRRPFGVADRVLDVLVPEVDLQRARVVAAIGERVTAGLPEHADLISGCRRNGPTFNAVAA